MTQPCNESSTPNVTLGYFPPTTVDQDETDKLALRDRILRLTDGMRFSELAEQTGCHRETVRRYANTGSPSALFLTRLCRALGVNGDWLLTGRGEPHYEEPLRLHQMALSDLLECLAARQRAAESTARFDSRNAPLEPIPLSSSSFVRHGVGPPTPAPHGAVVQL